MSDPAEQPVMDRRLIHHAVAWQARTRPGACALVHAGERTGYAELDAAADAYAAELQRLGVGPGDLVPVLVRRSPELVAVLLAVLRCGAAYSALDHRWPAERMLAVTAALRAELLVADRPLPGFAGRCWGPPAGGLAAAARSGAVPEPVAVDPSSPAMVFFTSGTTGRPKGVLSPHRATTRLFAGRSFADFGRGRVMTQAAPVPWDAFALELWGMLTTGGTSVIVPGDQLFPGELRELTASAGVDTVWLTASLFNLFVDEDLDCFTGLRQVMTGGERLSVPHVRAFVERHPQIGLLNGYGPVESCVFATTRAVRPADCDAPHGIPVGRPAPGTAVHLLDGERAVEGGTPGEICLAGDGLALGYLDNPAATAEKFVTVRLDGVPTPLYRTGDLGSQDDGGVLHYLGRADRQIKISGYRVEPAEIEQAALRLPGVRECAVLPVPDPSGAVDRLALFYRGAAGCPPPAELQHALAGELPHYMVPPTVRRLDALPRSANGKLDQPALLAALEA
ncbi:amino acid adenylation domain-containing protein [Kitasatospora sp. LaBMicrA B282]|uniref:amino acid adenylation domain-containing protein n=1 Tax=Kitasatospora sp. LaBMicrA B282 TaxID=3420949 RepID=UPI003D0A4484